MATLTRTNSRATPGYKDYVNFLGGYKNGKKETEPVKNFPLSSSSSNTSSSSLSSDMTDFSKKTGASYNSYLENAKSKKFGSVKPNFEERNSVKPNFEATIELAPEEKKSVVSSTKQNFESEEKTMRSEIFIEIQPAKSVSEVSRIFENKQNRTSPPKSDGINSKISIFEKQSAEKKPKIANKPLRSPPPKIEILPSPKVLTPPPSPVHQNVPPPPPMPSLAVVQKPVKINESRPPPAPVVNSTQPAKLQATLTKGPQTMYSVDNPNGFAPNQIDRNDPLVKKLVYGTLRGLYGAYHDKANDMLSTMPKNMVVKSNGVQDRIEQIAANGDLDKLNGRVNPKLDQE